MKGRRQRCNAKVENRKQLFFFFFVRLLTDAVLGVFLCVCGGACACFQWTLEREGEEREEVTVLGLGISHHMFEK